MNKLDYYFKQVVSQSHLDQSFDWVQAADWDLVKDLMSDNSSGGGPYFGGIVSGGAVSEQAIPDLTVQVTAMNAWGKSGERIFTAVPVTSVDCSEDEYGASTAVVTPTHSRVISIFARRKISYQDPVTDGNGLQVYSKQMETMEFFVRMGTTAVSPTPPPLLTDAVLLVDITRAHGQLTIQDINMTRDRREDWLRLVGTTITSFVHGSSKAAIADLFTYVDSAFGGSSPFSFGEQWYGSVNVGIAGGSAPTTVAEALDALVEDLASTAANAGAMLVGIRAVTGTSGGLADMPAGHVRSQIDSLATLCANHMNNVANQHPASQVTTTAYQDFSWLLLSHVSGFSAGTMRSEAGGTATAVHVLGAYSSWILVRGITGTWTVGQGIDYGATYVSPEAYLLARVDTTDLATAGSVQATLEAIAAEVTAIDCRVRDVDFLHYETEASAGRRIDHTHLGGGDDPRGPINELKIGQPIVEATAAWPVPYQLHVHLTGGNISSICRGWDYLANHACAYAVGIDPVVSKVFWDLPLDSDYLDESHMDLTIDAAGTLMSTLSPTRSPYAVACNGKYFFVLTSYTVAPGSSYAEVYAYDARVWRSGGAAQWVWTATISGAGSLDTINRWKSNLVANEDYVVALLGAQDCNTGTPLARLDAETGLNVTLGKGDGDGGIGGLYPSGGLAISKENYVFYTASDGATNHLMIPATSSMGSTGKGQMTLAAPALDVACVGRFVCCVEQDDVGNGYLYLRAWDYTDNDKLNFTTRLNNVSDTYHYARMCFGGGRIWIKACDYLAGENHCLFSVHPGQIVYSSPSRQLNLETRYQVTPHNAAGAIGGSMGRICAFGGAVYSGYQQETDDTVYALPLNRAVI